MIFSCICMFLFCFILFSDNVNFKVKVNGQINSSCMGFALLPSSVPAGSARQAKRGREKDLEKEKNRAVPFEQAIER